MSRIPGLTANARATARLYEQPRGLVLRLLEAESVEALYRAFMGAMREDFKVEYASMILFGESGCAGECRVEPLDAATAEIGGLLRSHKAVCGALRREELAYLFPDATEVGSAALMPLYSGEELGLIAVGSADANRYSSNMGTLFLAHISDVMVRLLPRLPQRAP